MPKKAKAKAEAKPKSKIGQYARKIQQTAKELKAKNPKLNHRTAIKQASQKLKSEGYFKT